VKKNFLVKAFEKRVMGPLAKKLLDYRPIDDRRGWWKILEQYAGAWQQDVQINLSTVDAYWANFACVTLIASDISKMPINVMQFDETQKIWIKTKKRPVLKKPNHYQTTIEFIFSWIVSQLRNGNTYVLKVRDPQGFITKLYVLDPWKVCPLITKDGAIYYRLEVDNLSGLDGEASIVVPASEIIHDRMYPLYHPLVGLSPLFACAIASMQGAAIMSTATGFFNNRGLPAGILTAPGHIPDDTAARLKTYFDDNFTGQNAGKVAVLGDNLKFESLASKAADAQLIEQLKMTGEIVAACYHVPGYKIGVGQMPTVNNTAALNQQYYEQCLQYLVEKMESRLDDGLELIEEQCWCDTSVLMRMDPQTRATVIGQKVKDGVISPNEARREDDSPPVTGGDLPYMQQQNYSLADLERRSQRDAAKGEEGNVQAQAMNGAQVSSLQSIITSVANGEMPPESAAAAISVAFPLLTEAEISAIITPLKTFKPTPTPTAPSAPAPANEPEDPEGQDDGTAKSVGELFTAKDISAMLDEQLASLDAEVA
jgi:HK97 family phage portal protein